MNSLFSGGKGNLGLQTEVYGRSVSGVPLHYFPAKRNARLMIIAGIHGEEPETTVVLSRALRCLDSPPENAACILAANPDGLILGTRGNARGVDLNRNFSTRDWQPDDVSCRWHVDEEGTFELGTGTAPESEPESVALRGLIETLNPELILSLHAPLGCIDDPLESPVGLWLSKRTAMPLVKEIGYPTPGSLGTWADEKGIPLITWEFPRKSIEELSRESVPILCELLKTSGLQKF